MKLEQKAEKLIKEYGMIDDCDNVLAAFSGGSDSSAMLFYLVKKFGVKRVFAAHLNHMIRGDAADGDERFAVETCKKYGVEIFTDRRNIPEIAESSKKSVEEAARDERYDFLNGTANILGGVKIATAHILPDNTESVLLNLARGCGSDGLRGIPPVNNNIIRPFLLCSKQDILDYCKENNIDFTEDATNSEVLYARNFIRLNIASKLKERFKNSDENIFKTSEIMRTLSDFTDSLAEDTIKENDNIITIDFLLSSHTALRRAIISKLYEKAFFSGTEDLKYIRKLEYRHILYVEEFIGKYRNFSNINKSLDLPGFVTAFITENKLILKKIKNKKTSRKI
ncbi:MAG: tRNA lysidine(34) synthetase TilS [Oscillospiraceae bacterium]|nr:tRNA lysidine(34) synthetase TilS [Oscillospiraceae bacterium]